MQCSAWCVLAHTAVFHRASRFKLWQPGYSGTERWHISCRLKELFVPHNITILSDIHAFPNSNSKAGLAKGSWRKVQRTIVTQKARTVSIYIRAEYSPLAAQNAYGSLRRTAHKKKQLQRQGLYQYVETHTFNLGGNFHYPCLCLCFGFSQITLIAPFLLMILHFSQIGFTEDLTFIFYLISARLCWFTSLWRPRGHKLADWKFSSFSHSATANLREEV